MGLNITPFDYQDKKSQTNNYNRASIDLLKDKYAKVELRIFRDKHSNLRKR